MSFTDYQSSSWSRNEPGTRRSASYSRSDKDASSDSSIGTTVGRMITAPFWMTAAGINWMSSGVRQLTDSMSGPSQSSSHTADSAANTPSTSGRDSSWTDWANPAAWGSGTGSAANGTWQAPDQSLGGDDLKYVTWAVVFTKPGYETVLEPMQNDLVAYSTETSSYAAMKIAKFVERARFGRIEKPHAWVERSYAEESSSASRRAEGSSKAEGSKHEQPKHEQSKNGKEKEGWRIPNEDQQYVQFLYRVEWRLPKREAETTHVERVTVERTATHA